MKKSQMVSGMNFGTEFLSALYKKVVSLGGTEEAMFNTMKTDSPLIEKWAEDIVVFEEKGIQQSLSYLLDSLKLDWINSNITEKNFPIQPEDDMLKKEYEVFNFGSISSEEVISNMEEQGYRPATLRELLKWGMDNWDGKKWIVALGQTWLGSDGNRLVALLGFYGGERGLRLNRFRNDWIGDCWFLAVRK